MTEQRFQVRSLSFWSQLTGEVQSFLKKQGIHCTQTNEAVVELVAALAHYREEGVPLFPEVFVTTDITRLVSRVGSHQLIRIGSGPRNLATVREALKKCSALSRGGWVIYIERAEDAFRYGVFCGSTQPLALSTAGHVLAVHDRDIPLVVVSQVAESVVEVRGGSGHVLHW